MNNENLLETPNRVVDRESNFDISQNQDIFESHSNETESDDMSKSDDEELSPIEFIRLWAAKNQITHTALNELLHFLNENNFDLPNDCRSILKTPRQVLISTMGNGHYWHFGLSECLKVMNFDGKLESIRLNINVDGLPISRSSKAEFWPIQCSIADEPSIEPMIVGIYFGHGKPPSPDEYLEKFIDDLVEVLHNGIFINYKNYTVKINAIICDTPARCFVKGKSSKLTVFIFE